MGWRTSSRGNSSSSASRGRRWHAVGTCGYLAPAEVSPGEARGVTMWDAVLFTLVFTGFFVIRAIVATIFFYCVLPDGDRCPNCDAVTLRVQSPVWNWIMPRVRTSWCYECNWHGLLRRGPLTPAQASTEMTKTL
jgi:hypothetical protein